MAQVSTQQSMDFFKKVWGNLNDLRPELDKLDKLVPFENSKKIGDSYVEAFITGDSVGITFAGSSQDAFEIRPAIAGSVIQSTIKGNQTVLTDVLSFGFMARGESSEGTFGNSTKITVKNHIESHNKFINVAKLYGQADDQLGYISYAPAGTIYRGATYSGPGTITLTTQDGNTIAFTNGVNVAQKAILFAPGSFASGHWIAKIGLVVQLIDSTGGVVSSGKLVSYDSALGIIFVDFVPTAPTAATGAGSIRIGYDQWNINLCMVGMKKILTNTSVLFGIDAARQPLWKGNVIDLQGKRFNLKAVFTGVSNAVNAGGLTEPMDILVNPRTFGQIANDESSFRKYDSSYKSADAVNGFEAIEYYAANGVNRILASPNVKEGDVFGIVKQHWRFSGSQLPAFKINGLDQQVIWPLQNQAGFGFRSYADCYLMCRMPARQILWKNANDEGIAFE